LTGGNDRSVALVWQECDGPTVNASVATGFGTKLIDRVISHDLDGKAEIDFDPAGVRCTIAFRLGDLANRRPTASDSATA
jgi:two-component sensor histidine kinase